MSRTGADGFAGNLGVTWASRGMTERDPRRWTFVVLDTVKESISIRVCWAGGGDVVAAEESRPVSRSAESQRGADLFLLSGRRSDSVRMSLLSGDGMADQCRASVTRGARLPHPFSGVGCSRGVPASPSGTLSGASGHAPSARLSGRIHTPGLFAEQTICTLLSRRCHRGFSGRRAPALRQSLAPGPSAGADLRRSVLGGVHVHRAGTLNGAQRSEPQRRTNGYIPTADGQLHNLARELMAWCRGVWPPVGSAAKLCLCEASLGFLETKYCSVPLVLI